MTDGAETARSSLGIAIGIAGGVRTGALAVRFAVTTSSKIAGAASTGCTAGRLAVTTITSMPAGNCAGAAMFSPAAEADVTIPSDASVPSTNPDSVFTTLSNHSPYALNTCEKVVWLHGGSVKKPEARVGRSRRAAASGKSAGLLDQRGGTRLLHVSVSTSSPF